MKNNKFWRHLIDLLLLLSIMGAAILLSFVLSGVNDDNNPFAMAVFILAVVLVARFTDGYGWGIAASLLGTFCVNYMFTYPFWAFDVTYPGYPLTMTVMLIVSILVSALTTQTKQAEQLRFEAQKEKMHANLLRAIAHDIRTPLASILGAASALDESRISPEDQHALIASICRDARWLVRVTENLLSVTRFAGNHVDLKKEDEVLEEIIGSAILKYRQTADSLPVEADEMRDILIVPMDATLIIQVLLNLFDNVSVHAQGATRIWLHIASDHQKVTLSVEDDGPGIPPSQVSDILNGTFHSPRSDNQRNMGIGLSVCRTIISAHGGDLTVTDSHHGGAALRFTLPL